MHPNTMKLMKTWVYGPMCRTGCVRCEKSRHDFVARIFALIAPVHPILRRVSWSYEMIPNAPKHNETHQNMSLESNGVDQVLCCEKLQRDFVAWTYVLIAPIQYVLQQISCSYETIPNGPKYYETDRSISLESNGVDWVRSLRKIPTWLRGTYFCINCTSSHCFAPSLMQLWNDPKCTQTLCNAPKHKFRVQWGGLGALVEKILVWLCGTSFRINYTNSPCFASSFMRLRNDLKCTQILCNAPKHEFTVQCGGLGAFVAKNPGVTSWHVLLH